MMGFDPELNIFKFLDGVFGTAMNGAMAQTIQSGLQFSHSYLRPAAGMVVLTVAVMALMNRLSLWLLVQRTLRVLVVAALITSPDLYNRFVVQPVGTTLPNQISQAFGGSDSTTMSQQFATIYTDIGKMSSKMREQTNSWYQFPDRFMTWLAELSCKFLLMPEYLLLILLKLYSNLVVIVGTIILIFFMFDTTKSFGMAWIGNVLGSLIVYAMMSISLQLIYQMNVSYMQQFTNLPMSGQGFGLNVSEGLEIMINIAVLFLAGFFMMVLAFVIGFHIGKAAGINATAALTRFVRGI